MSRRHLLPPENDEYLERLGLTEQDVSVYVAVLESGLVSVGEIIQLTSLDFGQVLESVRDLVDLGLAKKALGTMPRYYATLPFLKETISIEKETLFSLDSMAKSLTKTRNEVEEKKNDFKNIILQKVIQVFLDTIYEELIAPIIVDFEKIKSQINENEKEFQDSIKKENEAVKKEIEYMVNPLKAFAEVIGQQYDVSIIKKGNKVDEHLTQRKSQRLAILKNSHTMIGENLAQLKNFQKEMIGNYSNQNENISEQITNLEKMTSDIQDQLNSIQEKMKLQTTAKEKILAETIVIRQRLMSLADTEVLDPSTNSKSKKGASSEDIHKEFTKLNNIIKGLEIDTEQITNKFGTYRDLLDKSKNGLSALITIISERNKTSSEFFDKNIDEITKNSATALNSINDTDEASLKELKESLTTEIGDLRSSLKTEGKDIIEKIVTHTGEINNNFDQIFNHWEDRLLSYFKQPMKSINPFIDDWRNIAKPMIDELRKEADKLVENQLLEPLNKIEKETFATLITRIQYVKAMLEVRASDLQHILDYSEDFDYYKSSDTWVVVGIPSIYATLTDMLSRTRNRVTIVTPRLNLEMIENALRLKPTIRITFAADMDPEKDARMIKRLKEDGRVTLRRYTKRDLYGCIRDSEEIIFGYEKEGEEIIGIRSSTPSMVQLLEDRLNEIVIRNAKQI